MTETGKQLTWVFGEQAYRVQRGGVYYEFVLKQVIEFQKHNEISNEWHKTLC